MHKYGYSEIRTPIFEKTELFKRGVGEETDIVSKEMYSWFDQGGDNLTLKPELTAPVVRAFIQHNMGGQSAVNRLYYKDACFRRERPQKGRTRQFHQFGAELFGSPHPEADVEIISISYNFFKEIGIKNLSIKLNTIGSEECRNKYRKALKDYLKPRLSELTETSRTRFEKNPLRILDTKIEHEIELIKNVPNIAEFLTAEDQIHFDTVKALLSDLKIPYTIDPLMVRGLDYYTRTTYEITSSSLGAQDALCGGGRYDNLVKSLGGKSTPAVGFGAGMERLILSVESIWKNEINDSIQIQLIALSKNTLSNSQIIASVLRENNYSVSTDTMRRSLKSNLRDANRNCAKIAIIIGDDEASDNSVQVKDMKTGEQQKISIDKLIPYLSNLDL
jgi:histidyl-tRNA synthetase